MKEEVYCRASWNILWELWCHPSCPIGMQCRASYSRRTITKQALWDSIWICLCHNTSWRPERSTGEYKRTLLLYHTVTTSCGFTDHIFPPQFAHSLPDLGRSYCLSVIMRSANQLRKFLQTHQKCRMSCPRGQLTCHSHTTTGRSQKWSQAVKAFR